MAANPTQSSVSSTLQLVASVFGLLAGVAAVLYIAGGAVLALRLWYKSLPVELPISELPQTLLVTIALTEVLLPSMIVSVLYLSIRVVALPRAAFSRWFVAPVGDRRSATWYLVRGGVVGLLVAAALLLVMALYWYGGAPVWNPLYWAVAWAGCLLFAIVMWRLNTLLHDAHPGDDWGRPIAIVKSALLVGLASLPVWVVNGGIAGLPTARACGPSGTSDVAVGWLLGETSDRLYFGGRGGHNGAAVIWVPSRAVNRVVISTSGKPADELSC